MNLLLNRPIRLITLDIQSFMHMSEKSAKRKFPTEIRQFR